MKYGSLLAITAVAASLGSVPAEAKGCIKGALAGGIAGHYAGHGVLGAVGGCVVGRRLANDKAAREREQQLQQQNATPYNGVNSPDPSYKRLPNDPKYSTTMTSVPRNSGDNPGALYNGGAYQRQ